VDHPRISRARQTISVLFDNRANDPSGEVPFYDKETIDPFAAAKGHQIWAAGDPGAPNESADFRQDRTWSYCRKRDLVGARNDTG
jgi:hypothetical protein